MSPRDPSGEVVERVAVEVHVAAEADDAAVLSQGGEGGGVLVGRRLEAGGLEPLLELEGGG